MIVSNCEHICRGVIKIKDNCHTLNCNKVKTGTMKEQFRDDWDRAHCKTKISLHYLSSNKMSWSIETHIERKIVMVKRNSNGNENQQYQVIKMFSII